MYLTSKQKDMLFELMETIYDLTKNSFTEDGDSCECLYDVKEINKEVFKAFEYDFLAEVVLRRLNEERYNSDVRNKIRLL